MTAKVIDWANIQMQKHHGKGIVSYLIYGVIFFVLATFILLKVVINFLTFKKSKLK